MSAEDKQEITPILVNAEEHYVRIDSLAISHKCCRNTQIHHADEHTQTHLTSLLSSNTHRDAHAVVHTHTHSY